MNTNKTVQIVRQDANTNGTYRYSVTYQDGSSEVIRWRATGDYSHALIFGDGRISFRSAPAPSIGGAICLTITKPSGQVQTIAPTSEPFNPVIIEENPVPTGRIEEESELEEYIPNSDEIDYIKLALTSGENLLLTGPTGCGKTHALLWAAKQLGRKVVTIQGGDGMTPEHIIGYRDVIERNGASVTVFRPGLLTKAMEEGAILYCDEPNALPDGIRFYFFSAMDFRHEITIAEDGGRIIRAKAGFSTVGAMNEGAGYMGTSMLNFSFRRRFGIILDLPYLSEDKEAVLLHKRSGADMVLCEKLARVAFTLRQNALTGNMKTPVGTASLLACAKLIALGTPPLQAAKITIVSQVPVTLTGERGAVSDVFAANFNDSTIA